MLSGNELHFEEEKKRLSHKHIQKKDSKDTLYLIKSYSDSYQDPEIRKSPQLY